GCAVGSLEPSTRCRRALPSRGRLEARPWPPGVRHLGNLPRAPSGRAPSCSPVAGGTAVPGGRLRKIPPALPPSWDAALRRGLLPSFQSRVLEGDPLVAGGGDTDVARTRSTRGSRTHQLRTGVIMLNGKAQDDRTRLPAGPTSP